MGKIAFTIPSILNVISDLNKSAEDYDLVGELYYGGGLQRTLELLGKNRERKFIKLIANGELKNKQKWRKEREALIVNDKAKKSMNLDPKAKEVYSDKDSYQGGIKIPWTANVISTQKDSYPTPKMDPLVKNVCHICGKLGNHVLSVDRDGKPCVQYVACKSFVDLQPRERKKLLYKKRLCCKCLKRDFHTRKVRADFDKRTYFRSSDWFTQKVRAQII